MKATKTTHLIATAVLSTTLVGALLPLQPAVAAKVANHTILVYMIGTDLESPDDRQYATKNIAEMTKNGSNDNVNIIVETGSTNKWHFKTPVSVTQPTTIWRAEKGNMKSLNVPAGNPHMLDKDTLTQFIKWGVENYPATHYDLVFWDHGGGPNGGFGSDENGVRKPLSISDLSTALKNASTAIPDFKFDLIGFDACYMASTEVAKSLSPFAQYLVASEDVEPGPGWDYSNLTTHLGTTTNANLNGGQVGTYIAQQYRAKNSRSNTVSVTDLSKINAVDSAVNNLFAGVSGSGDTQWVRDARAESDRYRLDTVDRGPQAVDLGDFVKKAATKNPALNAKTQAVITAVSDAVIYTSNSSVHANATGLTFFLPETKTYAQRVLGTYTGLPVASNYKTFLQAYVPNMPTAGTVATTGTSPAKDERFSDAATHTTGYEITLDPKSLQHEATVYSVTAEQRGDQLVFLGLDHQKEQINPNTGLVEEAFDGETIRIGGSHANLFYEETTSDGSQEFSIPAKINGVNKKILVRFDRNHNDGTVEGVVDGADPSNQQEERELPLLPGDQVIPQLLAYSPSTQTFSTIDGTPFQATGQEKPTVIKLEDGSYKIGVYSVDDNGALTISSFAPTTWANTAKITLNSQTLAHKAKLDGAFTLVPARELLEDLGARVQWNATTRQVTITKGSTSMEMTLGETSAVINGEKIELDTAPVFDSTVSSTPTLYVPTSEVLDALNIQATLNNDTDTLDLKTTN